jgi:hypothetical protein
MPSAKKKPAKKQPAAAAKTVGDLEAAIEALEDQKREAEAKQREAAKPKSTPEEERVRKEREQFYKEHKEDIDWGLKQCTGHLKQLDVDVAFAVIGRLRDHFLKNGIR